MHLYFSIAIPLLNIYSKDTFAKWLMNRVVCSGVTCASNVENNQNVQP